MASQLQLNFPNPIEKPEEFFDRIQQLERIRETISSPTRRIAVIMGERVTGKTSLLNIVRQWAEGESWLDVVPLAPVPSRSELMEAILEGMAMGAGTSLSDLGYHDLAGGFARLTVAGFQAVAAELSGRAGRTFVVCLDELDSMLLGCPDDYSANEILNFIMYVSNTKLPIRFVFTLTRVTQQLMRADATPFITAALIAEVTPWDAVNTRDLVEKLWPSLVFDDAARELLFAEGGGHPYLTKAILQPIVDAVGPDGGMISVEQVREGVGRALAAPELHLTWSNIVTAHFSREEIQVLLRLAGTAVPLPLDSFATTRPALIELERRHYVRRVSGQFVLASRLLGRWLLGQAAILGPPADNEVPTGVVKLRLDEVRRRVFLGDREVQFTIHEYRFLECLARDIGAVVGQADLADAVWPGETAFDGGRLHQLVHRLRLKLGDEGKPAKYVETRRGFGFSAVTGNVERIGDQEW